MSEMKVIQENSEISKANKATFAKIYRRLDNQGLKDNSKGPYVQLFKWLGGFCEDRPLEKLTSDDIDNFINKLKNREFSKDAVCNAHRKAKPLAESSMNNYKAKLKKVYSMTTEDGSYPKCVGHIKTKAMVSNNLQKSDLLTTGEITRLVEGAENPRDRCLFKLLYESACRVDCEFLQLRRKDITIVDGEATLHIRDGKTGPRSILCIQAVPETQSWLSFYPNKDPEAYLFPGRKGKPMDITSVAKWLHVYARRAGIEKKIFLHLLRHSRLTELARVMNESELRIFAGWSDKSSSPAVYIHMSQDDVDNGVRKASKRPHKEQAEPEPIKECETCEFCETKNHSKPKILRKNVINMWKITKLNSSIQMGLIKCPAL